MCTSNSNGNCYCGVVGFRFSPSDEEIISHYLKHKMSGNDDLTRAISEIQLCEWEPGQLPSQSAIKSGDHVWYFFCRRDKKYANSQRDNRKTKEGFWKVTGYDRTIRARDGNKPIGTKRSLVYHKGSASNAVGTNWVIHEYRPTADTIPPNSRDFVVCRLEEKPDEKNSPSRKGECGSSAASTSNNRAANNIPPERGPHLPPNTGPMDALPIVYPYELNVGQPRSHNEELDDEFEQFLDTVIVDPNEVIEETVSTLRDGYRPSRPCTRVYIDDCSETETVMGNVQQGPHLEANTGPFVGKNAMDYELAVQTSMEEQGFFEERGLFVNELSDHNGFDQNWMQEQVPVMGMSPNGYFFEQNVGQPESDNVVMDEDFADSLIVVGNEVIEEPVNTLQHGYRPSRPRTRVYLDDCSETETVMGNVQNQPYNSEGSL